MEKTTTAPTEVGRLPVARHAAPVMHVEVGTLMGLLVALGGILCACHLEHQSLRLLLQPTAFIVVVAGTVAAVLIQYPLAVVKEALIQAGAILYSRAASAEDLVADLAGYARLANKSGLLILDEELTRIRDPFLSKALTLAIDGMGEADIRSTMELDLSAHEHTAHLVDQVFETAGATTPPLGILGAVLGLIHVMHALGNLNDVGPGIAAAFVSTLYGVALANLFILPLGGKLRLRELERQRKNEMLLEGVLGIVARIRPRFLENRLGSYVASPRIRQTSRTLAG